MRDSLGSVAMTVDRSSWVSADFNGIIGQGLLCIAHSDTVTDSSGRTIQLKEGMSLTVFDHDMDDAGRRDDLVASGVVRPPPPDLQHTGSKWVLQIDARGIRHESELA